MSRVACVVAAMLAISTPALADTAPAAVLTTKTVAASFDPQAATNAYLATLSPQARARSDAYFEGGYWLQLWDFLIAAAISLALMATRLSARMRDLAARITRFEALRTALYAFQYFLLTELIQLPWAAYEGYFREHQYGLSNQDFLAWLIDSTKMFAIVLVAGPLAVMVLYLAVRKARRAWWLWGALVAMALLVFQIAISPTLLEPIFNKFYPLPESALKQQLLSLARANEVPATQVYEFDASKQTNKISGHVSGLFGTAQISLNDNLMTRASPEEVLAVMGHEMGHYVLNHIYKGLLAFGVLIVIGFAFIAWAFERISARYGARWGFSEVGDVAALPLLVLLFSLYAFVLTPVFNTVVRSMEAEADAFGLNAARQPDGFAQAAMHLSEYRKMEPGPIEEFIFFDHPSGRNRIYRAMVWKRENQ